MVDTEKVKNGLEHCLSASDDNCHECPYYSRCLLGDYTAIKRDVLDVIRRLEEELHKTRWEREQELKEEINRLQSEIRWTEDQRIIMDMNSRSHEMGCW